MASAVTNHRLGSGEDSKVGKFTRRKGCIARNNSLPGSCSSLTDPEFVSNLLSILMESYSALHGKPIGSSFKQLKSRWRPKTGLDQGRLMRRSASSRLTTRTDRALRNVLCVELSRRMAVGRWGYLP